MRPLLAFLAAAFLATPAPAAEKSIAIGYVPAFKGLDEMVERGGFEHYSHLVLAFVNVGPSGEILADDGLACAPSGDMPPSTDSLLQRARLTRKPSRRSAVVRSRHVRAIGPHSFVPNRARKSLRD